MMVERQSVGQLWENLHGDLTRWKYDTAPDMSSVNKYNRSGLSTSASGQHPDYVPPILDYVDINNVGHREGRAAECPLLGCFTERRAQEVWESGMAWYETAEDEYPLQDDSEVNSILTFWDTNGVTEVFRELDEAVTTHGWAFIVQMRMFSQVVFFIYSAETIHLRDAHLTPLSMPFSSAGDVKYDVYGRPIGIRIPMYPGDVMGTPIYEKNFIFVSPKAKKREIFGKSAFYGLWDLSVALNETLYSLKNFLQYFALIPVAYVPPGTKQDQMDRTEARIKGVRFGNKALVMKGTKEQVGLTLEGAGKIMPDFPTNLDELVRIFSGKSGYPFRWYMGDPNGALSAASQDGLMVIKAHETHFAQYIPTIHQFNTKFVGVTTPAIPKTLFKLKATEKEHYEAQDVKVQSIVNAGYKEFNEMRTDHGLPILPEYKGKLYIEVLAEKGSLNMGVNVQGLPEEKKPEEPNESDVKRPEQDSVIPPPIIAPPITSHQDSFYEKYKTQYSKRMLKTTYNLGSGTTDKVDTIINDIEFNATDERHILPLSVKTDSMSENDEFYIIDAHVFDARAKLPYTLEDGSTSIERNPPEEIAKWVRDNMNQHLEVTLGVEHEFGLEVEERAVGYVVPLSFDGVQDSSKLYVRKSDVAQYPNVLQMILKKEPIDLSAAYRSRDLDSLEPGWDRYHSALDVHSVVFTAKGRCAVGGGQCATVPQ